MKLVAPYLFGIAVAFTTATAATSSYWYTNVHHNGISPTIANGQNWTVFRNVRDYGARGDGTTDDTAAIQKAIDSGDRSGTRASGAAFGMTGQPAVVFFPPGTYSVKSTITNRVGTVLMGDPTDRPTIQAAAAFQGSYLLVGHDPRYAGLVAFYSSVKNLVLDTKLVAPSRAITLLEWGVSQASQLSNIVFKMPVGSTGHTGLATPGQCTQLLYNDLQFVGGGVGMRLSVTQVHLKNIHFQGESLAMDAVGKKRKKTNRQMLSPGSILPVLCTLQPRPSSLRAVPSASTPRAAVTDC